MKRLVCCVLLLMLALSAGITVCASENLTISLDKDTCTAGEYLRVNLEYNGSDIGAFLAEMEYDSNSLRYVRTDNISGDYVKSAESSGIVRSVYTYNDNGKGTLFTVVFKVLPGAEKADISVKLYDIVDNNAVSMGDNITATLSSAVIVPSGEALLLDLIPSAGELNEDFSPYTTEYSISVPYEVDSMSFEVAVSQGAKCSINRKNLGPGGSTTDFLLTVSSEDGETKNIYTVKVTRGEYVRPSGGASDTDEPEGTAEITTEPEYEPLSPEYEGEEVPSSETENQQYPQQNSHVERAETPINSGNNMIFFLAGVGVCLVCVLAGVLIAKLFGNTGKHTKH